MKECRKRTKQEMSGREGKVTEKSSCTNLYTQFQILCQRISMRVLKPDGRQRVTHVASPRSKEIMLPPTY